jgi:hypothetical protein
MRNYVAEIRIERRGFGKEEAYFSSEETMK